MKPKMIRLLTPSDLKPAWRALAAHAIANGWELSPTKGGHIAWRSPAGRVYFTASTTSDWRSVRNARAHLRRLGLPR